MSIKVRTVSPSKRFTFEFEAPDTKKAFEQTAALDEIFGQDVCGNPQCNSANLRYVVRNVDGNSYYELVCRECDHKLAFGQQKVGGTLFPRRFKVVDKKTGKTAPIGPFGNGWHKYSKDAEEE